MEAQIKFVLNATHYEIIKDASFILQAVNEENRFLLQYNGRSYYIGSYLFYILKELQTSKNTNEIVDYLNIKFEVDYFNIENINKIIEEQISPLLKASTQDKKSTIYSLFKVFDPEKIQLALNKFSLLFKGNLFYSLLVTCTIINLVYFLIIRNHLIQLPSIGHQSVGTQIIYFISIISFLIIHEIGHASASIAMGAKPGKIGFGIYFIFPAFYTDLTNTWGLSRKKRIVINLGGIYFQLIINIILMLILYFNIQNQESSFFLRRCISFNIGISIYNLNPFFKFDGYWIYSDWFDLPNLREQSNQLTQNCLRYIKSKLNSPIEVFKFPVVDSSALILYTLGYLFFMSFIWYILIRFTFVVHFSLFKTILEFESFRFRSIGHWTSLLFTLGMVFSTWVILYFRIRILIKNIRHAK